MTTENIPALASDEPMRVVFAIPSRISQKWLLEAAQDAGFGVSLKGEIVAPAPHHDVTPYLRRLLKALTVPVTPAAGAVDDAKDATGTALLRMLWDQVSVTTYIRPALATKIVKHLSAISAQQGLEGEQ